jgi:protein arginine N-methyltransferase 1
VTVLLGDLTADMLLQLAPAVRARVDRGHHVVVETPNGTIIDLGPRGFDLLALFAEPVTLGDAVQRVDRDLRPGFLMPTLGAIHMLIEEGALTPPGEAGGRRGWADPVEHARMLHDSRRTGDFIAAVAGTVRPGDVVVDIGTGSGVLAVAAARAGARHVYALESSDIALVAERVFEANGVADKVTLIAGWSKEIELPERADVLVTETIGNEPLEEDILGTVIDARNRLLKPGARLIPSRLTLLARPLLMPAAQARQRVVDRFAVARWRTLYGVDFEPLREAADPDPVNFPTEGELISAWPAAGPPAILATIDLSAVRKASVQADAEVAARPGPVNAIAVTFRATLHERISHELDPWTWPLSSWATSVWVLPATLHIGRGSVLRVHYRHRVHNEPDGISCDLVERATPDAPGTRRSRG